MAPNDQPIPTDTLFQTYDRGLYKLTGAFQDGSVPNMINGNDPSANQSSSTTIDPGDIGSGVMTATINTASGSQQQGKKLFTDTVQGYILGLDPKDGLAKFAIGNVNSYMQWDGATLTIVGSLTATTGQIGGTVISATALTGGTIQTAASGQRVVMEGSDSSLRFFDSVGQVIGIGSTAGTAIVITGNATTVNGVNMTSTTAGVGFSYTNNSNVNSVGIDLINTSNGGTFPSIRVSKTGSGEVLFADITGSSIGVYMLRSAGSGAGPLTKIHNLTSGGGSMLYILNNGVSTGQAIEIDNTISASVANTGILMAINGGNVNLCYAFRFNGSEIVASGVGGSQNKKIRVSIAGTDYFIPLNTA